VIAEKIDDPIAVVNVKGPAILEVKIVVPSTQLFDAAPVRVANETWSPTIIRLALASLK
jgi:hypothetical protein